MALDSAQELGYAIEDTAETDPITPATTGLYWKFGIFARGMKNVHPIADHNWENRYTAQTRNPSDAVLIDTLVSKAVAYYPVNTVAHYLALGSCVTTDTVHAINNLNTTALPTITVRSEGTGGTDERFISATGCKVHALTGMVETMTGYPFLTETLGYHAIKQVTPTLNSAHGGAKYPTDTGAMNGTETKTRFRYDQNASFHWDSNSDGEGDTDYTTNLLHFDYRLINLMKIVYIENQTEPEFLDEGKYRIEFNINLERGASDNIYKDYKAKAKTHDMYLHIHAGATNYETLSFVNCAIFRCKAPYQEGNTLPVWSIQGTSEDFAVASKDGIAKTVFYGE
jgi:hypothetical protein